MRILATLVLLLLTAVGAGAIAQETPPDSDTFTELDGIDLGEQVWGPKISRYDLAGKVVVCYHWCITCPRSTGAFPQVKKLCENYRGKGVAFIGFQVRRPVPLRRNNVVWALDQLRPNFPITRRGWVREWPVKYLPWAVVFDHTGKEVFADNLPGLQKAIDKALAKAPDWMFGGPYEKLAETVAAMKEKRRVSGRFGKLLTKVRALAADPDTDPATRAEAESLIAAATRYYRRQIAKAEEDLQNPNDQYHLYHDLALPFLGDLLQKDALARRAAKLADILATGEQFADSELRRANRALRRLPPAGNYTYNMDFQPITDRAFRMRRATIIAAYLLALERIGRRHPKTFAADQAESLAVEYEVPELSTEDVKLGMRNFEARFAAAKTPYARYEAIVLLHALNEGYYGDDALAERVDARLEAVKDARKNGLDTDAEVFHRRFAAADEEMRKVRDAGEALSRKQARQHIDHLESLAASAGAKSALAERITSFVEQLQKSFAGPASLGVAFDTRFEGPGVRIYYVRPQSAAHHAGLHRGDVVLRIDKTEIESVTALRELLKTMKVGKYVTLTVRRGETAETESVRAVLGRRLARRR